jgi:D-beta-D-heptose 7-phosphate kinase / D-beta-D-heptose 1-phosphate adenosyltransferase
MIEQLQRIIGEIEQGWSAKRLLVVGDVMLDKYIWGAVERISPEAPVPVVCASHHSEQPGGAGNVALNLARLGARVTVVSFTGADESETILNEKLHADGISPVFVRCEGFPTVTKLRILGGRQQMLRLDSEQLGSRLQFDYDRLIQSALDQLPGCDGVILSDYAKGTLTPEVCQAVIQAGRQIGIPVLVDPKSRDFSHYRGATAICPNMGEISKALRMEGQDLHDILSSAEAMVPALGLDFLAVTLSEKGIALVGPGQHFIAPASARQVFDVSGAGDTVIAIVALCLACGLKPETAIELANVAAGIVVGKVGTVPVEKHELLAALAPEIAIHTTSKVVDRADLIRRVMLWKANGQHVVFTNGCFDLLHVGHITLLEQARRLGDKLIVAVNNDDSIRTLKGPERPIVGERERARVLAALAAVDAVVIFPEATPLELILAVQPDVIVKGGDYRMDTIVGAREVQSWGGQVRIIPLVEGFSTTSLVAGTRNGVA